MSRRERYTNPFAATGGHSPALYASMGIPIGMPVGISPYGNPMISGFGIPVIQQPIQQPIYHQQSRIYDPFGNDYPANAPISRSQYHEMQRMAPAYHTEPGNLSSNPFDDGQYTYPNHASFETPQTRQYNVQMYRTFENDRMRAHQLSSQQPTNNIQKTRTFTDSTLNRTLGKNKEKSQHENSRRREMCRLTKKEREYVNNPDNFLNKDDQKELQDKVKKGDKSNNKEQEAFYHRSVQEFIKNDIKFTPNIAEKQTYAWNSLQKHVPLTINRLTERGFTFDDSFYYCPKSNHYFLTNNAISELKNIGHNNYSKRGITSLINNNTPKNFIYLSDVEIPGYYAIY